MEPLKDKLVLVTGASAGIGRATARTLARAGARVVVAARREERLRELAEELPGAEVLVLDVRDEAACRAALAERAFDVVVANAGLAIGMGGVQDGDPADWSVVLDTNVKGVLHVARHTIGAMIARGSGDLVFLGSVAGRQVYPGGNVYCASKHAVRALYEAHRLDARGTGVRVSTVDPGMVETDFSLVRFEGDAERAAAVYEGFTPLTPEDVADAIHFVVSRPRHVNIGEVVLWPTDQASTTLVHKQS